MFISKDFSGFEDSIKDLINFVQNGKTRIFKVKVNTYIWNFEDIKGKEELGIDRCKLCPADLMVLAEIFERRVMENVISVNLSNNSKIVDDCFVETMVRIITAIGCCKIVMRNSGCEKAYVKRIKKLLGKEEEYFLKFILE